LPDDWLAPDPVIGEADAQRRAYVAYLSRRLAAPRPLVAPADAPRARAVRGAAGRAPPGGGRVMAGHPFQYAVVRVIPRVERGESLNAGVILLCRPKRFLAARTSLEADRLRALAPDVDPLTIETHLAALEAVAARAPDAGTIV